MPLTGRGARRPQRITFLILRYMRRPLMTLIAVYAISMVGWILIPGIDAQGNPERLSFFHAFYFLTYTVTTTGFGELPHVFTEAQRMWGIVSLYSGVIAWFYALGSIVGLVQNTDFQLALDERRFAKRVKGITEPFCIVCGFGNTGALLTRGLTDAGMTVVIIDKQAERIKTVGLRDYRSSVAGLCADARVPEHLLEAGLTKPNCYAIVALTQDEELNLKIAVAARLLCEHVQIVTQSTSSENEETLSTLGSNVHIIDPFQTFARYLGATVHAPAVHLVNQWLAGTRGATLDRLTRPPEGRWVVCGLGRMGSWLTELLHQEGIQTVGIDPNPIAETTSEDIVGRATRENLIRAGIGDAAGIIITTESDTTNLSIVLNARKLNPKIFVVVRQSRYRNVVLFEAAKVDMVMVPSLVSGRRILFLLIAPMLKTFFECLSTERPGEPRAKEIVDLLRDRVGGTQPRVWTVDTAELATPALKRILARGIVVTLHDLLRDPANREVLLPCVPLVLESSEGPRVLPGLETPLGTDDRILFCGSDVAQRMIDAILNNEYMLIYLATGTDEPRGWVMQWLYRRLGWDGTATHTTSSAT